MASVIYSSQHLHANNLYIVVESYAQGGISSLAESFHLIIVDKVLQVFGPQLIVAGKLVEAGRCGFAKHNP